MPRDKRRLLTWRCPLHKLRMRRDGEDRCPQCGGVRPEPRQDSVQGASSGERGSIFRQRLLDRRDYRQALIHRIEYAAPARRKVLEVNLRAVEAVIKHLRDALK